MSPTATLPAARPGAQAYHVVTHRAYDLSYPVRRVLAGATLETEEPGRFVEIPAGGGALPVETTSARGAFARVLAIAIDWAYGQGDAETASTLEGVLGFVQTSPLFAAFPARLTLYGECGDDQVKAILSGASPLSGVGDLEYGTRRYDVSVAPGGAVVPAGFGVTARLRGAESAALSRGTLRYNVSYVSPAGLSLTLWCTVELAAKPG